MTSLAFGKDAAKPSTVKTKKSGRGSQWWRG